MRYIIKSFILCSMLLSSALSQARESEAIETTKSGPTPRELVQQLMEVWQTGDLPKLTQIVTKDAQYVDIPNHATYDGIDGFKQYVAHVHNWADDVKIDVLSSYEGVNFALAEWRMQAIQARPIANRVPLATGRKIDIRGVTIIETEKGLITKAIDYIDVVAFMGQLGFTFIPPTEELIGQNPPTQE